jgi:hypothetical protein
VGHKVHTKVKEGSKRSEPGGLVASPRKECSTDGRKLGAIVSLLPYLCSFLSERLSQKSAVDTEFFCISGVLTTGVHVFLTVYI